MQKLGKYKYWCFTQLSSGNKQINYKELLTLSNITRNKKGQIIDPLHKTLPFLTRYEKAKILGLRANQINHGSKPFVSVQSNDGHTITIWN